MVAATGTTILAIWSETALSSMSEERGWRVAAPELEQSAIISARSILIDRRAIATELQGRRIVSRD
jgi:hypothetical protein